jgi:archaellum component FlaC
MQTNKKIITIAITALLLISMLAAATPALAAIGTINLRNRDDTAPLTKADVGTIVTVTGNASFGGKVELFWDNLAGEAMNSTFAAGNGQFKVQFVVPAAVNGEHFVIVRDASGDIASTPLNVTAKISLSPNSGIPGDIITVTGTGFAADEAYTLTFGSTDVTPSGTPKSNSVGSFTATFTIPDSTAYGNYTVTATQAGPTPDVSDDATLRVGASIALTPNKGPVGTVVTVNGRGFRALDGTEIDITMAANTSTLVTLNDITLSSGTFTGQFIVPEIATGINDFHVVTANDGVTDSATANFNVTGVSGIIITPTSARPGETVTIEGGNFTAISGTEVKINFGEIIGAATFVTNSTGGFKGSFNVPMLPTDTYDVVAEDENGLYATLANYQVAITMISVSPGTGPSGSIVTVTGYGFNANVPFNVTFASLLVKTGTSTTATGAIPTSTTFRVPTISATTYSVTVTDDTGLTATVEFTVNATSQIVVAPTSAPKNAPITVTVTNFGSQTGLRFYISNSSWRQEITGLVTPSSGWSSIATNGTNSAGQPLGFFIGTFKIDSTNIALGTYTISVNNTQISGSSPLAANNLYATAVFTLGSPEFIVSTRASSYSQGDTISFKVQSSYGGNVNITILDPEGIPGFAYVTLSANPVNGYYVSVYSAGYDASGFKLPSDAPLGTWTWNATNAANLVSRGEFTVTPSISSTVTDISDKVTEINDNILTIKTETGTIKTTLEGINAKLVAIEGKIAIIDTTVGQIKVSITDLPSSVSSGIKTAIADGMATITTSIGEVKTKLTSLDASISSVSGDMATLKTSIGDMPTTLSAINTKVTSIEGNVATLTTDVGTLKGVVAEVKDGIATINTGVGTLTTNVASLQEPVKATNDNTSNMSTMIYVAVAFAIIAAIAAVASILLMRKKIAS